MRACAAVHTIHPMPVLMADTSLVKLCCCSIAADRVSMDWNIVCTSHLYGYKNVKS